jgi:hypothetical protein
MPEVLYWFRPPMRLLVPALLLLFFPAAAAAAQDPAPLLLTPERIRQDLAPLEARLIKGPGGELLLNKGQRDGVARWDLFTLYAPGEPVVDPATGSKLGELAAPAAVCRAERVHPGFSELAVQCPASDCEPAAGYAAVRYKDIPAVYIDTDGPGYAVYKALRAKLSHLDWQGYRKSGPEAGGPPPFGADGAFMLTLVAEADMLTLWCGDEIRAVYSAAAAPSSSLGKKEPRLPEAGARTEKGGHGRVRVQDLRRPAAPDAGPGTGAGQNLREPGVFARRNGVLEEFGVMERAQDGASFLVTRSGGRIEAACLAGGKTFQYEYNGFGKALHLSISKRGFLALNIYVPGEGMRSRVLRLSKAGFRLVAGDIGYLLAFVPGADEAAYQGLWGQRFRESELLQPVVHRFQIKGGALLRGSRVKVPAGFNLSGAFQADFDQNGSPEIGYFDSAGHLRIRSEEGKTWESGSEYGGSLSSLLVEDPMNPDAAPRSMRLWTRPAYFERAGRPYVVCAMNPKPPLLLSGLLQKSGERGRVGLVHFSGGRYQLHFPGDAWEGPVRSVSFWKDRILVLVGAAGFMDKEGSSRILTLPLEASLP